MGSRSMAKPFAEKAQVNFKMLIAEGTKKYYVWISSLFVVHA